MSGPAGTGAYRCARQLNLPAHPFITWAHVLDLCIDRYWQKRCEQSKEKAA